MVEVGVHEAKTHFSRLLQQALDGEDIVITRSGEPIARLVPVPRRGPRELGFARGTATIMPGFDDIPEGFEDPA